MRDEALLRRPELLEEGHVLAPMPLISGPDEVGDGVLGDLEDLGEDLVGDVGGVARLRDELPELELEEVVDLGLGKLFHFSNCWPCNLMPSWAIGPIKKVGSVFDSPRRYENFQIEKFAI